MFKKRKRLQSTRSTLVFSEDEDDQNFDATNTILTETKYLQSLRKRSNGINTEFLAKGERRKTSKPGDADKSLMVGGLVNDVRCLKQKCDGNDESEAIGTSFSAETNKRDEDAEMQKYIEQKMIEIKGIAEANTDECEYIPPEKAALMGVSNHLRVTRNTNSEEMLSSQMLCGIPEVDLGIESRIQCIEATEMAKLKVLSDKKSANDKPSDLVPSNMAVNFAQHNRFSIGNALNRHRHSTRSQHSDVSDKSSTQDRSGRGSAGSKESDKPLFVVGGLRSREKDGDSAAESENKAHKRNTHQPTDDILYNRFRDRFCYRFI